MFAILVVHGQWRPSEAAETGKIGQAADGLLANLGLVFIPAGVGISQHYGLIMNNGVALVAALVISTVLTLIFTVTVFRAVSILVAGRGGGS